MKDSLGRRLNRFEWKENRRLLRFNTGRVSVGSSFRSKEKGAGVTTAGTQEERDMVYQNLDGYVDFNVPWSFSFNYVLDIRALQNDAGNDSIVTSQSITFNADINLTKRWKITASSGYDFQRKDFVPTRVNLHRDMHCWEMSFNWIPFGSRQSYSFTLNVKSAVLQQLRLNRNRSWYDYDF